MPGTKVSATDDGVVLVDCKVLAASDVVPQGCCSSSQLAHPPFLIEQLLGDLRVAFKLEKDLGNAIDNSQDPVSFGRLNDRVRELLKIFLCRRKLPPLTTIPHLAQSYAQSSPGDWQRFALFNDQHYVRNLVEANDDFELIVLCWKGGQVSRVHNHADSHCWLAVLDGEMCEVQYQRAEPPNQDVAAAGSGVAGGGYGEEKPGDAVYLEATKSTDMKTGDVGYINDHLALHSVGCYMSQEQLDIWNQQRKGGASAWKVVGGVTLHLYSPPIRRVKIYDDNAVTERTPGYYSKGGVRM